MGIFGKIFGGAKQDEPSGEGAAKPQAADVPADAPAGAEGVPARRERSKPKSLTEGETENVPLIEAIYGVARGDSQESRKRLYQAILDAQIYLVVLGDETEAAKLEAGEVNLEQGQQVSLATIRDPQGRTYLPAFTDVERMSKSLPDDARYLRIPATSACRMFLQGTGEGLVINPGQVPSGVITRGEAEILAQSIVPEVGEDGTLVGAPQRQMKIAIGKLVEPAPDAFLEAIRSAAAAQPAVREVHLFLAGIENQPPRQMIGVSVDDGVAPDQMQPTFDAIGKAAMAARATDEAQFDMMPLTPEFLEAIKPLEAAVYVRAE